MRIDIERQVIIYRLVSIEDPELYLEVECDLEDQGGDCMHGPALDELCSECLAELEIWADDVTPTHIPPIPFGWRLDAAPGLTQ